MTITAECINANDVYGAVNATGCLGFYALYPGTPPWCLNIAGYTRRILALAWATVCLIMGCSAPANVAQCGAWSVELEADRHAERFYQRMAVRRIGECVSQIDGQMRVLPLMIVALHHPNQLPA